MYFKPWFCPDPNFRQFVRDRLAANLEPQVEEIERSKQLTDSSVRFCHDLLVETLPTRVGGGGLSLLQATILLEELGYVCPAAAPYLEAGQLFAKALLLLGEEDQVSRYLGRMCNGELGAFAMTDWGTGLAPREMSTVLDRSSGALRLHGTKSKITFIDKASFFVCFAKDPECRNRISAVLVNQPATELSIREHSPWEGLRGHTAWDLEFSGTTVAERLGPPGMGLAAASQVLAQTRVTLAGGFLGLARRALDEALRTIQERCRTIVPLHVHQGVSFPIVDTHALITTAQAATYSAAVALEQDCTTPELSAAVKLVASQALLQAVERLATTLGGAACSTSNPSGRIIRDAFTWIPAQGTENAQRLVLVKRLWRDLNIQ